MHGRSSGITVHGLAVETDPRFVCDTRFHRGSEDVAVDGERSAGRHRGFAGRLNDDRIEASQFFFQSPTAFSSAAPRSELLQTSSASEPVLCAGPLCVGRIS